MPWIRQHRESGRVVLLVQVGAVSDIGGSQFGVFLTTSDGQGKAETSQEGNCYRSREVAFAAADALVRHRHGRHVCGAWCAGWIEDLQV